MRSQASATGLRTTTSGPVRHEASGSEAVQRRSGLTATSAWSTGGTERIDGRGGFRTCDLSRVKRDQGGRGASAGAGSTVLICRGSDAAPALAAIRGLPPISALLGTGAQSIGGTGSPSARNRHRPESRHSACPSRPSRSRSRERGPCRSAPARGWTRCRGRCERSGVRPIIPRRESSDVNLGEHKPPTCEHGPWRFAASRNGRRLADAEVVGDDVEVQEAEDEQRESDHADEREHNQDEARQSVRREVSRATWLPPALRVRFGGHGGDRLYEPPTPPETTPTAVPARSAVSFAPEGVSDGCSCCFSGVSPVRRACARFASCLRSRQLDSRCSSLAIGRPSCRRHTDTTPTPSVSLCAKRPSACGSTFILASPSAEDGRKMIVSVCRSSF
jgi:hypothetical protein